MCQVALAVVAGAGWQGWVLGYVSQGWGLPGKMPGTEVDAGQGFPELDWGCYLGGMARGGVGTGWNVCWGHLCRPARGPGSFQTTPSVLGLTERVSLCISPLRGESWFPIALWLPPM